MSVEGKYEIRKRKVYYGFRRASKPVPVIRLSGKYLARFGFGIGDTVSVSLQQGTIIITKA